MLGPNFKTVVFFLAALCPLLAYAQDGSISGATTTPEAAGYSCDPADCKLPLCNCASTDPPGGLDPSDVPQFIVFTADDAVQSYTLDAINQFLGHRKNPNGCVPKMTYFVSLNYTNYTLVTDWFVAGNEIADHTMTHVGKPSSDEINGNIIALNALAGIPLTAIKGFRAPFLDFSAETLNFLHDAEFTYDSSAVASVPVTNPNTDAFWPYTLDYGMANNCLRVPNICKGQLKLPGLWEIPMYAFFDARGISGPHLMDVWLDAPNGESALNDTETLEYMKDTFNAHYNGKRQPIGLYSHPIHLSTTYPGVDPPTSTIEMINYFLDWVQEQDNVWIVSNEQLLDWVRNPVPVSELDKIDSLKCPTPAVDPSLQICNGIPQNEEGLLQQCGFPDAPFWTCYGCPTSQPSPDNPNPAQAVPDGENPRYHLPANCSTPFWDPINGECICSSTASTCSFVDESRPIGPNGANLTGGGIGAAFTAGAASDPTYVPFDNAALAFGSGVSSAFLLGLLGIVIGAVLGVDLSKELS